VPSLPVAGRDEGEIIGFWGLALADMPHVLRVGGRELRAWCAWDTLFLPELIGQAARIESTCPMTGEIISLQVVPGEGVRELSPATAALSFLRPDRPFDADMVMSFCHFVHFFRDEASADAWTAEHANTFVISVEQGFEIGQLSNRHKFGRALEDSAHGSIVTYHGGESAEPHRDR
jgi:alkylmercury lyase